MDYKKYLNAAIDAVPPSGIRKFFDVAAGVPDVISLGVGEPDFKTPYAVREEAISLLVQGKTQYSANAGLLGLRQEIAYYLKDRFATVYDPQREIIVTIGASEAIDLSLRAIINTGDEVLVPEPSYVSYSPNVIFAGGVPRPVVTRAEEGFRLNPRALEAAITPRTKAVIMPYPNNPTGAILDAATLDEIAQIAVKHDLLLISDEIYAELSYADTPHVSCASHPQLWERCITINGFSKAFAMTGWRIGYLCAPAELVKNMLKIHQYVIMCAATPSQAAAEYALQQGRKDGYADILLMKNSYNQRRRLMLDGFRRMGLDCEEPLGAFYIFPSIRRLNISSFDFCTALLQRKKVACVPGTAFGASGEGFIRASYATSVEKLTRALALIAEFIQELERK